MVIIILDEFFIQCSDLLIGFLIRIIDFMISSFNKFSNGGNDDEGEHSKDENNFENKTDFNKGEIFKIGNFSLFFAMA